MYKKPINKKLIIILIIPAAVALLGIALGFYYSSLPQHHPQRDKQACVGIGGEWSAAESRCLLSYKKSGEICSDGGQCISGICLPPDLTPEQIMALADGPVNDIAGTCFFDEFATGCVRQVIRGSVSKESMCLD